MVANSNTMAMKGNSIKYLLLCLLQLALLSCLKETPESPAGAPTKTILYSVTVSQSPMTRVGMSGSEFAAGCYVFESGDKLYVEYKDGETLKLYGVLDLTSGVGETTGIFEGELKYLNGFVPEDNTVLNATVVGAHAADGFFSFGNPTTNPAVDPGSIVTGVNYPSSVSYATLPELVQKYSYFTGTGTFDAKNFNNLTQQSVFLLFNLSTFRKTSLADPSASTVNILIKNGSSTLHTVTGVPIGDHAYYGNVDCATVVQAGGALAGARIQIDDNLEDSHDPLAVYQQFSNDLNLETNHYYSISRTLDWFRIRAVSNTTITFNHNDCVFEYSTDSGESWTTYTGPFTLPAEAVACIKGNRTNYMNDSGDEWGTPGSTPIFTASTKCYISGNIMSLLADKENLVESAFQGAFSRGSGDNTVTYIDIDPEFPLILPATTLASKCYMQMFRNCTSLTRAPVFRAEEVAYRCCYNMFRQCSNLVDVSTIELPAMTLAIDCYRELLRQCSKVTSSPDLPAKTLVKECYRQMFSDTKLKSLVCLATTFATDCTKDWMTNVPTSNTSTFYKDPTMNGWTRGTSGIPNSWQIIDYSSE